MTWIFSGIGTAALGLLKRLVPRRRRAARTKVSQVQAAGDNATQVQAGGDVNVSRE